MSLNKHIASKPPLIELNIAEELKKNLFYSITKNEKCTGFSIKNFEYVFRKYFKEFCKYFPVHQETIQKELKRLENLAILSTKLLSSKENCLDQLNQLLNTLKENESILVPLGDYEHFVFAIVTKVNSRKKSNQCFVMCIVNGGKFSFYHPFSRNIQTGKKDVLYPKISKKHSKADILAYLSIALDNTQRFGTREEYQKLYHSSKTIQWQTPNTIKKHYPSYEKQEVDNCAWHGYIVCLNILVTLKQVDKIFRDNLLSFARTWVAQQQLN